MTVNPAIAPYVPTYATYTPYLMPAEYLAEPTGVDASQLVPGRQPADNLAALTRAIAQASGDADDICRKPLAATTDVEAGTYRVRPEHEVWVPLAFTPVIMITGVKVGRDPSCMTSMTDLSRIRVGRKTVKIPLRGLVVHGYGGTGGGYVYVEVTYVNGYAHTFTADASSAGDSTVNLQAGLGLVPGLPLTVYDGAGTEPITVDASYTVGSATVPLVAPLQYAHGAGVTFSALPPSARNAVILLITSRVKGRGAEAVVLDTVQGQATKKIQVQSPGTSEYNQAKATLLRLRRSA